MKPARTAFLTLLLCLLAACGEDEYHYPSVKLEFLTTYSDARGALQAVLTDGGERLPVAVDGTGLSFKPDSVARIVTNYERMTTADGSEGVRLYGALFPISPFPLAAEAFEDGICTDAAEVTSIWMGIDYLNILLAVKAQHEKHTFHFIEDRVTAGEAQTDVYLTLYHDAGEDRQAYTQRVYLSVPLKNYITLAQEANHRLVVHFSLHTYDGNVQTYDLTYPEER